MSASDHQHDTTPARAAGRPAGLGRRTFLQAGAAAAGSLALGTSMLRSAAAQEPMLWYSGSSARSVAAWAERFQAQTGIPTEHFRSGGVKLAQKFEAEVKAGQVRCSALDSSLPAVMMDWVDRGLMMEYESPEASHFPADMRAPGYWAPIKALMLTMAYNADLVPQDQAPTTWEDILDPKWKGKMVMADAFYSGAALHWYGAMRETYGKSFMEALSKQQVLIRRGSGATAKTVTSGERPLSPMNLHYRVFADIGKGANLQMVLPEEGVPLSYMVIGVPKDAPNPEAGKKFIDFALSRDSQQFWQSEYHTPSLRDDVEPLSRERGRRPLSDVKTMYSGAEDMRRLFAQRDMLMQEWSDLFK